MKIIKIISIFFVLFSSVSYAEDIDKGYFSPDKFKTHVKAKEPTIFGQTTYDIYENGEVPISLIKATIEQEMLFLPSFFRHQGYEINPKNFIEQKITIKIISIEQINDPRYFSGTNSFCKKGIDSDDRKCESFYLGRTIFTPTFLYGPITVYVGFLKKHQRYKEYSFRYSLVHEMFHVAIIR
jgi:hypothetical protein